MNLLDISVLAESLRSLSIAPVLLMLSSRVLTEFQPKRAGSISNPNQQRMKQQPKFNPYQSPNEILGLLAMLAPTAHIT